MATLDQEDVEAWYFCLPYPWITGGLVLFYMVAVLFNFGSIK